MKPLSLFEEIHQLSRSIYKKSEFSPYTQHPYLHHHSNTNVMLQNALSGFNMTEIHSTYRNEYEFKAIPLLEKVATPKTMITCIRHIMSDASKPKFELSRLFMLGFSAFVSDRNTDESVFDAMVSFFVAETNLTRNQVECEITQLNKEYLSCHKYDLLAELTLFLESPLSINRKKHNASNLSALSNNIKLSLWKKTLNNLSDYFAQLKSEDLFDVQYTYDIVQAFNTNFHDALLNCANQSIVHNMLEAVIGDSDNQESQIKHINPTIAKLWKLCFFVQSNQTLNSKTTIYSYNQDGLAQFIAKLTEFPHALVKAHIEQYDLTKEIPSYILTEETLNYDNVLQEQEEELKAFKKNLSLFHSNSHTFIFAEMGLVKLNEDAKRKNLKQLSALSKTELGIWLKANASLHLLDFTDHYRNLINIHNQSSPLFIESSMKYHWVSQFYWMFLNQCQAKKSRETNQLFFKTLSYCLVATHNSYKCYKGLYEEAMLLTPSLHQAFFSVQDHSKTSVYLSEIADTLFDHGISLYQDNGINVNLFYWWQHASKKVDNLESDYLEKQLKANKHLLENTEDHYGQSDKLIRILVIRKAFVDDIERHTNLTVEICYALADYLNLIYYLKKSQDEPNTLWELINDNVQYCEESNRKDIYHKLFYPLDSAIKRIPKIIDNMIKHSEKDLSTHLQPNIDMRILKQHDLKSYESLNEKRFKLMAAFNPETIFKIDIKKLTSKQKKDLGLWINPMIEYFPKEIALRSYNFLSYNLKLTHLNYFKLPNSLFNHLPNKYNVFFNLIDADVPLNIYSQAFIRKASFQNLRSGMRANFGTICTQMEINVNDCNGYFEQIIKNKPWRTDENWARFYFNWISYYGRASGDRKKEFVDTYLQDTDFRQLLSCNQNIEILRLIQIFPEYCIEIIDYYIDNIHGEEKIDINHCPFISPFSFIVMWIYFMYRLKDRSDLDNVRQQLHDDILDEMNDFVKTNPASLGIFKSRLNSEHQTKKDLFKLAIGKKCSPLTSEQANYLLQNENSFVLKWFCFDQFPNLFALSEDTLLDIKANLESWNRCYQYYPKALRYNLNQQISFLDDGIRNKFLTRISTMSTNF